MNSIVAVVVGLVLSVGIVGCKQDKGGDSMDSMKMNGHRSIGAQPTTKPAATTYTCTMHSEVVSDKPGKCPRCGMDLVPKK
jgi:Cu2+-exporting ATPase